MGLCPPAFSSTVKDILLYATQWGSPVVKVFTRHDNGLGLILHMGTMFEYLFWCPLITLE